MERLALSSRAIIGRFYETLEKSLAGSWASKVGMSFDSNQESEEYKWLGMAPGLREWIGGRVAHGLRSEGYTLKNKVFEATLEIDINDLRRDKTGQIQVRIDEMADRAAEHWEELCSSLMLANGLCYDGSDFYDTDHEEGDSGAQKNLLTATEVGALDIGAATTPTADEAADAIMGVIGYFYTYKDDKGKPINGQARDFIIMCPVSFWAPFTTAVSANNLNTGSGVRDNPLQGVMRQGVSMAVLANPLLTWTTDFAIFRTDGRAKPFILQEEVGVQVSAIAEGSEEEFKNDRHLYGVKTVRNAGYGMWQHAIKATFS